MIKTFFKKNLNTKSYILSPQKGFSLLELLVYVSILFVVTTMLVGVFMSISKSRGQSEARSEVNSNLRFAFEKLSQDIESTTQITTPAIAGDTANTISLVSGETSTHYCVAGGQLRKQVGGACSESSEAITNEKVFVESVLFTKIENSSVALNKTIVSIRVDMRIRFNSSSPDWQFASSKITTISVK